MSHSDRRATAGAKHNTLGPMIGGLLVAFLCAAGALELWVDPSSGEGGDGSAERPLRSLGDALARAGDSAARIHLSAGLYQGPFRPPDSTEIDGKGAVVLFREGLGVVIAPRGRLALKHVAIQGGSLGIETAADLRLEEVALSGQRSLGVYLRSGTLVAERAMFSAGVSEARGIKLEGDAKATLSGCKFQGPYRRAVELTGSSAVELSDCAFEGAVTGVHQVGGKAVIRRSRFSGQSGPAVFCARGSLEMADVDVHGHEYALQCADGAVLRVLRLSSVRAERAAVALSGASGRLEEITTVDSGSFGAIHLVGATLELRRFRLERAQAYGLLARHSSISIADGAISDVVDGEGSTGEGIHLRGSRGSIDSVSILRTAGPGLLAAADSSVLVRDLLVEGCRWGGVVAESFARIKGSSWTIRKCTAPAVAVPEAGEVDVDVLFSEGNDNGPFWVECARAAKLRLSRAFGDGLEKSNHACAEILR